MRWRVWKRSVVVPARTREVGQAPVRRAHLDDPWVYHAEAGERIRVSGLGGAFTFIRYDRDNGGDYAVVVGGVRGHLLERCVFVDRVRPFRGRGRGIRVRSKPGTGLGTEGP